MPRNKLGLPGGSKSIGKGKKKWQDYMGGADKEIDRLSDRPASSAHDEIESSIESTYGSIIDEARKARKLQVEVDDLTEKADGVSRKGLEEAYRTGFNNEAERLGHPNRK